MNLKRFIGSFAIALISGLIAVFIYATILKPEKSEARKGEPRHYVTNLDKIKQKGWPLNSLKNAEEIIAELVKRYKEGKTNGQ